MSGKPTRRSGSPPLPVTARFHANLSTFSTFTLLTAGSYLASRPLRWSPSITSVTDSVLPIAVSPCCSPAPALSVTTEVRRLLHQLPKFRSRADARGRATGFHHSILKG